MDALNTIRDELTNEVQKLRVEKTAAEAKASDAVSAVTEELKRHAEDALMANANLQRQLSDAQHQIQTLNDTVKKLRGQLSEKKSALA